MKKLSILSLGILLLFLLACGNELGAEQSANESDYLTNNDDTDYGSEYSPYENNALIDDNAHPFAIILAELVDNIDGQVDAFLVDVDGNGTEGMVVVTNEFSLPLGTLFYLYNGNLHSAELGMQDSGFVTATVAENNRLVNLMGDGGGWSYTLFALQNGSLIVEFTIRGMSNVALEEAEYEFYLNREPELNLNRETLGVSITKEYFNQIHARYFLNDIYRHWEMIEDENGQSRPVILNTSDILLMTID